MVKIYAISVFYKSTNDAKLLKSHYDLQSFSFFQRGEKSTATHLRRLNMFCVRQGFIHFIDWPFDTKKELRINRVFLLQAAFKNSAHSLRKQSWNGHRWRPDKALSRMCICVTSTFELTICRPCWLLITNIQVGKWWKLVTIICLIQFNLQDASLTHYSRKSLMNSQQKSRPINGLTEPSKQSASLSFPLT